VVYEAGDAGKMRKVLQWSRARNAGDLYVTDDRLPNPFDRLPSCFAAELSELARR
jgi:hypothetical protein